MNLKDREWSHDASHGGIEDVVAQESTAKVGHVGLPKQDNPAICYPFVWIVFSNMVGFSERFQQKPVCAMVFFVLYVTIGEWSYHP